MFKRLLILVPLFLMAVTGEARDRVSFNDGWRFILADSAKMAQADYNDAYWRQLTLPHDWAIEGDFYAGNPSGASGGALPGGVGWYRKHFTVDNLRGADRVFIDFDGVYMNSTVYINGVKLGTRPYGYSSFRYDLTPYLHRKGDNVIAVRVDNSDQPNSRWYSGCGIYRNVWLVKTFDLFVDHWGTQVVATLDKRGHASFAITTQLRDFSDIDHDIVLRHTLFDADGRQVGEAHKGLTVLQKAEDRQVIALRRPHLWSVADPHVYRLVTEVLMGNKVVDRYETVTGVRTFRFDAKTGFWLNGKNMKINGVCLHHDLGCLGAALNTDALHRQLTKMKDMGVNAIRCSHNPPSPELLNMCDTMGFIVMDESFDMWRERKTKNDYARFFDQWAERDLTDLVVRDRKHPSILMWSIGNEVLEQWNNVNTDKLSLEDANLILNAGHGAANLSKDTTVNFNQRLTQLLASIVRRLDPTRPITAGCNEPSPDNNLFKSGALDIIGFNYHRQWIKDVPKNFPNKPFMMTESVSALQTRGYYRMPSDSIFIMPKRWDLPYTDPTMMCSAYDNSHASWSSTHEQTWDIVKHTPYCSGQFIWTGFDYIGEPTPYGFPARSSYFGIIDLAGFPKDVYYMYQSEWTTKPVLHLFPHWNWVDGQTIDLWCYYNNADEVELFVNGQSQGVRRKADSHQYHVSWRVTYHPGEVRVVARRQGREVASQTIKTAGAADHARLTMDYRGNDTYFINAEVVDTAGIRCPWADDDLQFKVDNGIILGVDNGSQFSMERFKADHRKAFFGKALLVVRPVDKRRPVTVRVVSPTLKPSKEIFY